MKARSLYRATYEDDKIISVEPIWIGERIRDLLIYDKQLFILTDNSNLKIINVDLEQLKLDLGITTWEVVVIIFL